MGWPVNEALLNECGLMKEGKGTIWDCKWCGDDFAGKIQRREERMSGRITKRDWRMMYVDTIEDRRDMLAWLVPNRPWYRASSVGYSLR